MKAIKVWAVERIIELDSGICCRLQMDLYDVEEGRKQGLFLDRFRFSWIFFEIENPMHRVLIDCHAPFGVHVHFDNGSHQPVNAHTLDDVRNIFAAAIKKHFGVDVEV